MTLEKALSAGARCYAKSNGRTFYIQVDGSLDITRNLPSGKTDCEWYAWYETAMKDYPLATYNWHIMED